MNKHNAWQNFIHGIIEQAVRDWRLLCKCEREGRKKPEGMSVCSLDEIRSFFKSEWAVALCGNANPLYILRRLEKERKLLLEAQEGKIHV